MSSYSLKDVAKTGLLPPVLSGKLRLDLPQAAFDQCRETLVEAKILKNANYKSHYFIWGSDAAFKGLSHAKAEAVYITCVAESAKLISKGSTQKLLETLVKTEREAHTEVSSNTLWFWGAASALVLAGGYYFARKKR